MPPQAKAIGRSLRIYHAAGRSIILDRFYRRFLTQGGLAFDIGAHAGDRTACFRRLGARVVAVEPQPAFARLLRFLFARDQAVTRIASLVGASEANATFWVNARNPTISTASEAFIRATDGAPNWENEVWDQHLECPVTTLDTLIRTHGRPDFIKIDVEGFEAEVLAGLSATPSALSFEFTTIQPDIARQSLHRLHTLGYAWFNACLGESMAFAHAEPLSAASMAAWVAALPEAANSGDVYASLDPTRIKP